MLAETVAISGAGGVDIEAYLARPLRQGPLGGVVVIHHNPGFDAATKEITRRCAVMGYNAICPNLHSREGPGASPDAAAAAVRAAGGVPDDRLVADVGCAAAHLRGLSSANGRVGLIGFCSGGRQAFLAACTLRVDAAVDCYGAFVISPPPEGSPLRVGPVAHLVNDLSCPLLGLFGANDIHPSPGEVGELDRMLDAAGKDHEFHVFDGVGHAFFATDRPSYSVEAATEGWALVSDFFSRHLSAR
ncbi:MAG: dienelactone hydrolase family protein [Candidatus Dormibacteraeota bacterium]|uniref:Dienelactone hydrolase family protein n=1 Tax=Candidatus Amunia macphersoniae TaxID=3127014 RepID=A0A934KPY3_9BACT|nr:dienelactone hydrolase family protein [Candidatus Dormibacteraeota bacterium]